MKRRYVYFNIFLVLIALILPCPFLKFGQYTKGRYTRVPENRSILPQFQYSVPSFNELEKYLKHFSRNYSYLASLYELGRARGSEIQDVFPIYNLVLSTGYSKPIIVFLGGIYASDLYSPVALIQSFTEWATNAKILGQLLPLYDYHFIPLLNPAGYEFVYKKRKKGELFTWLKNMRRFREGKAVNLLHNFDNNFTVFPNGKKFYGGEEPFSEPESIIIRDYILGLRENIAAVFLLFSSSKNNAITYPYFSRMDEYNSWILQEQLATKAIMASKNISHKSFEVVSTAEFEGVQRGRMDDWLMKTLNKSVVLNIQLPYSSKDNYLLKNLKRDVRTILKNLVLGLHQDEHKDHQNHRKKLHKGSYQFAWKKI